jgi:hypothetical protein
MKQIFQYNPSDRPWHLPVTAGLCVSIPFVLGIWMNDMTAGKLGALGALVILYSQSNALINRMVILMLCGFGFILSFSIGVVFSFAGWWKPLLLGIYAYGVHHVVHRLGLHRPPGSFFFIMSAAIAISMPTYVSDIPLKIGYFTMGVMIACTIGFFYSLLVLKSLRNKKDTPIKNKHKLVNHTESLLFGMMMGISLLLAMLLRVDYPYWVMISCLAIMQGLNTQHVGTRAIQRVLGTVLGLLLCWGLLQMQLSLWSICLAVFVLQTLVEHFIVRNYLWTVMFISALTIFLAEPTAHLTSDPQQLMQVRLLDNLLGIFVGCIGGWLLYHERVHYYTRLQAIKTLKMIRKTSE